MNVSADYRAYEYETAGNAKYYGAVVSYAVGAAGGAGLSLHIMDGDTDRLQYTEYRMYGYHKINKVDIVLDLLDVKYKESINGVSNAYSAIDRCSV